jgi:hypothetical protein
VADALGDARQCQHDPADLVELFAFHLTGLHGGRSSPSRVT